MTDAPHDGCGQGLTGRDRMAGWIAVSDGDGPVLPCGPGDFLARGVLVLDIALPLLATTVLLDHAGPEGALSVIYGPGLGCGILHRHGAGLVRYMLPGALADGRGTAQMQFCWDTAAGTWSLRFTPASGDGGCAASGTGPMPMPRALLAAACMAAQGQSPALLWFGVTQGAAVCAAPMIGPRTPLATPSGPVAASTLRPGDMVLTRDDGPLPVLSVLRREMPGRGSFAPVRLRAPFFGAATDLLLAPDQQIALSGVEVEYLFGEDEILVAARHLVDGTRALIEDRRAILPWVAIDLGCEALLMSGGCALATAPHQPDGPVASRGLRQIDQFEARTLQAMRRRGATRTAA